LKSNDASLLFQEGRTALHLAAEAGHFETVEVLADFNAGPNAETIVGIIIHYQAVMHISFVVHLLFARCRGLSE
jgi:ankyrin repeat protein